MRRMNWWGALAGFGAGLLFIAVVFLFPALRALAADVGAFSWSFSLFCLLCFVLFVATPWFHRNGNISAARTFPFFLLGAVAAYALLFLAIVMVFELWQPQIL